ncbi:MULTISPECIES: MaoC family dehydratase [unclassified Sphingobium]|uniref:MaoC family dehydratase n=1 Tax=unclassified Sphingobium TaxID=2611147 RepID=UPI000D1778C6|nr:MULTISPECIES: MaoC family dehydratase [unclassified Sphingobium]MBG6120033.1 acyl dehydratase [Sphingobium sp. JAI105]PSO12911.1 enoyl-CoA hydratase [Sphingobium sp. AEW4]TWD05766.1 acyl dehydratase [Sphingobium sp. AEW010]TWD23319.1 acyl dehydratase [Sphingobium sp. AEW013]TWD25179.1 acyl dehydratase [Sphingobium sp. AEW001]
MIEVEDPNALAAHIGQCLGKSEWLTVDQAMITGFAENTGDDQWIHVDVERAARELPSGKTIAHGYLLVSLLPRLNRQVFRVKNRKRSLNYGLNKVRFLGQVQSGDRVRLSQEVKSVEATKGGQLVTFSATIEIEGKEKPALIAETMTLMFDS